MTGRIQRILAIPGGEGILNSNFSPQSTQRAQRNIEPELDMKNSYYESLLSKCYVNKFNWLEGSSVGNVYLKFVSN